MSLGDFCNYYTHPTVLLLSLSLPRPESRGILDASSSSSTPRLSRALSHHEKTLTTPLNGRLGKQHPQS